MLDLADLRARFRVEVARYEKLAARVEADLRTGLKEAGVYAEVTGRAKEEPNFLRKALKKNAADPIKHADPLMSITDRAGARAVVLHHEAATTACAFVRDHFEVVEYQDARDRLQPNELGYLGLHFLVRSRPIHLSSGELDLAGLICEIQIHTKAQSAWASVSHPMLYKPVGGAVSPLIAHRVNRAVALIDLFDEEIMRARGDLMNEPGYQPAAMLTVLESEYLRVAPRDFDGELSLQVLAGLVPSYSADDLSHYRTLIGDFMRTTRPTIEALFKNYLDDPDAHPLLFQPEFLAIFERVVAVPERLRAVWLDESRFDIGLLDSLRNVIGR